MEVMDASPDDKEQQSLLGRIRQRVDVLETKWREPQLNSSIYLV